MRDCVLGRVDVRVRRQHCDCFHGCEWESGGRGQYGVFGGCGAEWLDEGDGVFGERACDRFGGCLAGGLGVRVYDLGDAGGPIFFFWILGLSDCIRICI